MANSETYPVIMNDGPAPYTYRGVVGSASGSIEAPGLSELGSGTGSAFVLSAAPYLGARVKVVHTGSATAGRTIVTNSTSVTLNNQGDRTITFTGEGDHVTLFGVSTTRWVIENSRGATFS